MDVMAPSSQQGTPTVLVVDDEPAIVDSLQKILERESLRVLTAGSGGEALDILRREPISVMLTDLMMPGMSGMDLLRASKSVAPETETVLMTAYGTVENEIGRASCRKECRSWWWTYHEEKKIEEAK